MHQAQQTSRTSLADAQALELVPCPKRVRVLLGGRFIADSRRVLLLREACLPPVYYFPQADVLQPTLEPSKQHAHCPRKGRLRYWHVQVGELRRDNAAWACPGLKVTGQTLADYIAFDWDAMDAWYEEDEQVYVHPRDPFKRVDVLQGSRHVQVFQCGVLVADSRRPVLLFETGLPTRYYLPKPDVRLDLLVPSDTITHCPYKGEAHYYSMVNGEQVAKDLFWTYAFPTPGTGKIAGLLSFLAERVDEVWLDGERLLPPSSPWSTRAT